MPKPKPFNEWLEGDYIKVRTDLADDGVAYLQRGDKSPDEWESLVKRVAEQRRLVGSTKQRKQLYGAPARPNPDEGEVVRWKEGDELFVLPRADQSNEEWSKIVKRAQRKPGFQGVLRGGEVLDYERRDEKQLEAERADYPEARAEDEREQARADAISANRRLLPVVETGDVATRGNEDDSFEGQSVEYDVGQGGSVRDDMRIPSRTDSTPSPWEERRAPSEEDPMAAPLEPTAGIGNPIISKAVQDMALGASPGAGTGANTAMAASMLPFAPPAVQETLGQVGTAIGGVDWSQIPKQPVPPAGLPDVPMAVPDAGAPMPPPPGAGVAVPRVGVSGLPTLQAPDLMAPDQGKVLKAVEEEARAGVAVARAAANSLAEQAKYRQAGDEVLRIQQKADLEKQEADREIVDNQIRAIAAMRERIEASGPPTINPRRYWENQSAGQKVAGAIAGFLFGMAGKGLDYLGTIQREVDQDIEAQRFNYEAADRKQQREMAMNDKMYALARERGLDQAQARAAARQATLEQYNRGLEAVKMGGASAEALARVEMAQAGIGKMVAETQMALEGATNKLKLDRFGALDAAAKVALENAQLRLQAQIANQNSAVKAAGAGGGGAPNAAIVTQIAQLEAAKKAIEEAKAGITENRLGDAAYQALDSTVGAVPGLGAIFRGGAAALGSKTAARAGASVKAAVLAEKAQVGEALSGGEREKAEASAPTPGIGSFNTSTLDRGIQYIDNKLKALRQLEVGKNTTVDYTPDVEK